MLSTSSLQAIKRLAKLFVILNVGLWLTACLFAPNSAPTTDITDGEKKSHSVKTNTHQRHIVRAGETLYSIAWRYGLDYKELARINNVGNDYLIYVGQPLKLTPNQEVTQVSQSRLSDKSTTQQSSSSKGNTQKHSSSGKSVSQKRQSASKVASVPSSRSEKKSSSRKAVTTSKLNSQKIRWQWPAKGEVLTNFSVKNAANKGIDIRGKKGDSVYAAAAGNVVYAGSGLRGYGQLIIIKHNDVYLSAYAHNSSIRVREGQYVKAGQYIADIGSSGSRADSVKLHFEIRRSGKPVDPLRFLPKRKR